MSKIPGHASIQTGLSTSEPYSLSALQHLTEEQRSRWEYLIALIQTAETSSQVARYTAIADGYAQGLRDARAITPEQCDELHAQMRLKEVVAANRTSQGLL